MTPKTPQTFATARTSNDHGLAAFGAGLLLAFALFAGAFLPKLDAPAGQDAAAHGSTPSYASAAQAPAKRG
jgi:hypothetical protein